MLCSVGFSQGEANNWYFGINAGISFNSNPPVALTDGNMNVLEGCSTISDSAGNLLFYTNGIRVWNRNHNVMPNGNDLKGGSSSTKSSIIVKKPGSKSIYGVLTVAHRFESPRLQYSEVDMTLQSALGDINTNKNIPIVGVICEKVTAIRHQNKRDF